MSIEVERAAFFVIGYMVAVLLFMTADYICDQIDKRRRKREVEKK